MTEIRLKVSSWSLNEPLVFIASRFLYDISFWFIAQNLNEYIAREANKEDCVYWQILGRAVKSQALLDESAVLAL